MTPVEACLAERRPPLPWVGEFAAAIEGEPVGAYRTDAGARARSLATAADLFDLPAVSASFDPTLVAEAVGCAVEWPEGAEVPTVDGVVGTVDDALAVDLDAAVEGGRVPAVLDATERLVATLDRTSVLGGVAGPAWLTAALLAGADGPGATEGVDPDVVEEGAFVAESLAVDLANASLDRGVDGLVVLEPDGPGDPARFREAAVPLTNVVHHFDGVALLAQRAVAPADVELAAEVGFDAVTGGCTDPETTVAAADAAGVVLGVGVPTDALRAGPGAVGAFVDDAPTGALVSTAWAVPPGTTPEAVHRLAGTG